jgi:hypothetical protein
VQAIGRQPQRAPDGASVHYERRRPEQTTLYRLVQQHAATFFAQAEDAAGADLPQFVKDEFDAFLECGILAHGFLRLRCGDCGHDKLVAFSCKRRGFCHSCGARRMAQTAALLVNHVIPHVPVRQWVLSLPIPLRLLLAAQPKLVTLVLQVVHRVITRHLLGQAGLKADEAESGAVTLIQRFGSAANLNIHLHCLVLDGMYRPRVVRQSLNSNGVHMNRGKVVKVTFEIEYPDGSSKVSSLTGDMLGDLAAIVLDEVLVPERQLSEWNASSQDWRKNPTMLLRKKDLETDGPLWCYGTSCPTQ